MNLCLLNSNHLDMISGKLSLNNYCNHYKMFDNLLSQHQGYDSINISIKRSVKIMDPLSKLIKCLLLKNHMPPKDRIISEKKSLRPK